MARRFEFEDALSSKFWEIEVTGRTVTVRYGRIGAVGQTQVKTHPTPTVAKAAAERQVSEKVRKGYAEVGAPTSDTITKSEKKVSSKKTAKKAPVRKASASRAPEKRSSAKRAAQVADSASSAPDEQQVAGVYELLGQDDHNAVMQSIELLRSIDNPVLWSHLATGSLVDKGGRISTPEDSVIFARVSPRYRPFVALWVLSHSGRLSEVHALNLGGNTELDDLTPLAGLGALQALDLSGCNALTDIAPLAELRGLRSLDLSGCNALKDLAPLAGLTGLQSLSLRRVSRWFPPLDLSPIQQMRNLQSLDLSDWEHLDDLSFLQGLPALRSLNLGGCKRIVNLTPLGSLTNLTELDLSYCDEIAYHFRDAPPPFIQFKNLQRLSLLEVRSLQDYIDGDSEWLPRWSTVLEELTALSDFVPPDFYDDEEEEEDDED